ncbi:SIS domain-containing protein [Nostocoides australiense]|uniref:Sugar isomerase (SIS) n=1 Tax=Nostocoides australiense Ben110 TaxID=1193182 RepID=W6JYR5_9MICO|nr:SIS domain-containing protein [Tetrasphaera australiensis]MCA0293467.1 SIS domain-containing protein [Actinomycetota bacterium]CCH73800.1 Sugar isomerase (SIS) [Tetrasphaera australiensis Ben110]HPF82030.1 SIS domain-containing protein [Tetrasphaera australiensis]HRW03087.1 SIS domain-containing protein [Tetrasphaera sp.]
MTTAATQPDGLLNFDAERYVRIQSGAVARGRELGSALAQRYAAGRVEEVVLLGTGGAGILMEPALRLAESRLSVPVRLRHPAEELAAGGPGLGAGSAVVIPSLSGTTKESVAAQELAHRHGAWTAVLTAHGDSPLAQAADLTLVNEAADDTSSESFYLQSILGIAGLAAETDDWGAAGSLGAHLESVPQHLLTAKTAYEDRAEQAAHFLAERDYHIITGAGYAWPEAHYYGMCILEEMQWIRTRPVHAAHFFHGTLELLEAGSSLVVLVGRDETRELTDRVLDFARTITEHILVIDTADADLGQLPPDVSAAMAPVVAAALLERVSAHLEVLRDHPLTTRRYYRRIDY